MIRFIYLLVATPSLCIGQLQVEWKKEFDIQGKNDGVSSLLVKDNIVFCSLINKEGSGIFIQNPAGTETQSLASSNWINNLQLSQSNLYSMGGCQVTKRDLYGNPISETCNKLDDNWNLSSIAGFVRNSTVYSAHWTNLLTAHDLNGTLKWKKDINELTENLFLKHGGNSIYVYSLIHKPDLGGVLMQYDTLGNQNWSIALGGVNNIVTDLIGNCYVFCVVPQKSNFVNKYNSEGKLIWSKEVPGQAIANGSIWGDSLLVCGIESIDAANGQQQNPVFSILSVTDGKILYQQKLDFYQGEDEGYNESFTQIATDGKAIYLGGRAGAQGTKCFLVKLSKEGPTRLTEETKNTSFTIFPNPSGSKFTINCTDPSSSPLKVTVRNITGQIVHKETLSSNDKKSYQLNLEKQPSGNYTVEIENGNKKVVKKVVVE